MYAPILLPSHNPNTYPSRLPGFDPTHPMAKAIVPGHGFSGIATGNAGFINLLTGAPGVKAGTLTAKIDPYLGQSLNILTNTNNQIDFAGQLAEAETKGTFGSIVINNSAGCFFFNTSTGASGTGIGQGFTTAGSLFNFSWNGIQTTSSTITFTAGIPYFFACSSVARSPSNTLTNFVVKNLKTGLIQAETVSTAAITGANLQNGTYRLGNRATSLGLVGSISCMMYAPVFSTVDELYKWALDPWAFWYPHAVLDTMDWVRAPIPPPPILMAQICM